MKAKTASREAHPTRRDVSGTTNPPNPVDIATAMLTEARSVFQEMIDSETSTVTTSFIVDQFTDALAIGANYSVRKDVTFRVQQIGVYGDSVSVWLEVKCRGRLYVGELRHRVPVIPAPTRYGGMSTWSWTHDLRTIDRKPCPPGAADLVRGAIEGKYRDAFDESDPSTVELLIDEVTDAYSIEAGVVPYRDVVAMIDGALKTLSGK